MRLLRALTLFVVSAFLSVSVSPESRAEKVLRIGVVSLPQDLGNPFGSYTTPTVVPALAVFDSLTLIDETGEVQPWIAERWDIIDELTWRFTLKPDVFFSNGDPFDAQAAADILNYFASGDGLVEVVAQSVIDVDGARAIDALTLEVTSKQPNILLPRRLAGLRMPAAKPWAELGRRGFGMAPIGSGPFSAERWDMTRIDLVANRDSWRPPKLDRIEIIAIPEVTSRVQGLITGALDIAMDVPPDSALLIEPAGAGLHFRPSGRVQLITFMSVGDSPVSDVRVRQALNYAINRQRIIDVLLGGATQPSGQAAVRGSFGFNPDISAYPYDPEKARALLAEAGYPDGFDMPTDMTLGAMAGDGAWYLQIAQDLAEIGVNVTYVPFPYPVHIQKIRQGGWEGIAFSMDYNNLPSMDVLWPLRIHSCLWRAPWHCRPEWVPLIEEAEQEFDLEERRRKTQELVRLYHEEPTSIYLWDMPGIDGVSDRVLNYRPRETYINMHEMDLKD